MDGISVTLTVFFEGQFYVGLVERTENNELTVSRIVFGAEPKADDVYRFELERWYTLVFSPPVAAGSEPEKRKNPKRMQREATRQIAAVGAGIGTKSQQALQLQREENKLVRKENALAALSI